MKKIFGIFYMIIGALSVTLAGRAFNMGGGVSGSGMGIQTSVTQTAQTISHNTEAVTFCFGSLLLVIGLVLIVHAISIFAGVKKGISHMDKEGKTEENTDGDSGADKE